MELRWDSNFKNVHVIIELVITSWEPFSITDHVINNIFSEKDVKDLNVLTSKQLISKINSSDLALQAHFHNTITPTWHEGTINLILIVLVNQTVRLTTARLSVSYGSIMGSHAALSIGVL